MFSCSDINIQKNTPCTTTKKKLPTNPQNKVQLITLLTEVFRANGITVVLAEDDAEALIVGTALDISFTDNEEAKAEYTDILCLLVHHYKTVRHQIFITTFLLYMTCMRN